MQLPPERNLAESAAIIATVGVISTIAGAGMVFVMGRFWLFFAALFVTIVASGYAAFATRADGQKELRAAMRYIFYIMVGSTALLGLAYMCIPKVS
jgi:hypothetical protein